MWNPGFENVWFRALVLKETTGGELRVYRASTRLLEGI